MKYLYSFVLLAAQFGLGTYILAVAHRGATHLGIDIVRAVWFAIITLLVFGLALALRTDRAAARRLGPWLPFVASSVVTAVWAWLIVSGRVVSHESMMAVR